MIKCEKIIFINPPYEVIGVTESVSSVSVTLSIAMLAGVAKKYKKEVKILDLNLYTNWEDILDIEISKFDPDLVGITFTTPLVNVSDKIGKRVKEICSKNVVVIGGGAHATAMPIETLETTCFDAVAVGEAEETFEKYLANGSFENLTGWYYKDDGKIWGGLSAGLIENLDSLPFGAYELFETNKYIYPKEMCRANPVCLLETSRGCYAKCTFCNKNIFGFKIRRKSAKRVVDEMEYILSLGFKEIHLADDLFTADMKHAKHVCEEIICRGLKFHWVPRSGIRVDRVSAELLKLMKEAGCYHIPFGIESGNQEILDSIKKGITIEEIKNAIKLSKEAGLETTGYFMFGLPGETPKTVQETINLALELKVDHIKFGVTIPLPGTPLFEQLKVENRLITFDWAKYTYSTPPWEIYNHPTLSKEEIENIYVLGNQLLDVANKSLHISEC